MQDWQNRVCNERAELDVKLDKLTKFLESDTCKDLDEYERERLRRQQEYMAGYADILTERIKNFK